MAKDISQSLLILSSEPRALFAAEQFLIGRGWTLTMTSDEKVALSLLIERRPSFFMISVQHKNRKVRQLHTLVKQTFPELCVLLFAEHHSMEAYRQLLQSGHPYRIQPPVTGPGIERAVNRFLRDAHEKELQDRLYARSLRRGAENENTLSWAPIPADEDSLLERGADLALEGAVRRGDGVVRAHLTGKITNTACIIIESMRFSGYLIAAMAGDRPFNEEFTALVRERLVQFLRESGEVVKDGESFPMKIREVKFAEWATDYAEFLKRSVHEGDEVAFAFFPMADVNPQVGLSAVANMVTVKVEDLVADETVDFNVHLHLPANARFLLYTAKGSVLMQEQKNRLIRSGVHELHIKSEDIPAFKRYRAHHHISGLIKEFEERQKSAAA